MRLSKPILIGSAMAFAMLYFMHDSIMSGTATLTSGLGTLVALHVAVVLLFASLVIIFPPARRFAAAHRPSREHMLGMALGMFVAAGSLHLAMHGIL